MLHPSDRCAEFQDRPRSPPMLPTLLLCPTIARPSVLVQLWHVASPAAAETSLFDPVRRSCTPSHTTGETFVYSQGRSSTVTTGRSCNPSVTLSIGLGWQRHRR